MMKSVLALAISIAALPSFAAETLLVCEVMVGFTLAGQPTTRKEKVDTTIRDEGGYLRLEFNGNWLNSLIRAKPRAGFTVNDGSTPTKWQLQTEGPVMVGSEARERLWLSLNRETGAMSFSSTRQGDSGAGSISTKQAEGVCRPANRKF